MNTNTRFEQFIREKQYLLNVSPCTVSWYRHALKWLPCENPNKDELFDMVIRMRERGLKPTGCNAAIRAINCYLRWSGSEMHVKPLREPQEPLPVFTEGQVALLLSFRPSGLQCAATHVLTLLLLDTGIRISEALRIRREDIDENNLLLTIRGKGGKCRIIPFSYGLRKRLHLSATQVLFPFGRCLALRRVKALCRKLGFEPPPRTLHAFRHTFAVNYIRRGGSVFHLQKMLGHSSLEMSRRYANLQVGDLQMVHERISLLSPYRGRRAGGLS